MSLIRRFPLFIFSVLKKKISERFFFIFVKNSKGHQKMVYLHMPNQCNNKEENDSPWIRFFGLIRSIRTENKVQYFIHTFLRYLKTKMLWENIVSLNAKMYFHFVSLLFPLCTKCIKCFP